MTVSIQNNQIASWNSRCIFTSCLSTLWNECFLNIVKCKGKSAMKHILILIAKTRNDHAMTNMFSTKFVPHNVCHQLHGLHVQIEFSSEVTDKNKTQPLYTVNSATELCAINIKYKMHAARAYQIWPFKVVKWRHARNDAILCKVIFLNAARVG